MVHPQTPTEDWTRKHHSTSACGDQNFGKVQREKKYRQLSLVRFYQPENELGVEVYWQASRNFKGVAHAPGAAHVRNNSHFGQRCPN